MRACVEAAALRTNEAPLTGESQPVEKQTGICPPETPLAERHNMVFLGTSIASGSGRALVVATGMETEVGHIATLLETASSDATPLQRRLDQVARRLLWACLGIVALVFTLGLLRAMAPFELFLSAVSLAVAAIPEGLPAVVTDRARPGRAAHGAAPCAGAAPASGRDAGVRSGHLQ